ncbi:DUF226 domain-containing protein (plasmid) [Borrelia coriaceae]|uniref:Putative cytosolic protein n=1 Tax=Borrelia coriaceae ATCC 43381 TaxID=1408429 RepID=W5SW11_9SPIR|nr:DUF226 domain-containing protein [Borrelia coriaceae]AHH11364.1 Putative cytosolic protein [Borrelia coriaceae ATCC 43381]UPA17510.1 DUF226 domain-containing protein [Borrelia coriaceae]
MNLLNKLEKIKGKSKLNSVFSKIESENTRTIYYTKIFNDIFAFGSSKKEKGKFFISLRSLFDIDKKGAFHLFSLKEQNEDKFLGMYYGFKRLTKPIFLKYKDNVTKTIETSPIYRPYYIEFRFKKGSIFCYIKAIHALKNKEKFKKNYAQNLLERIINLEKEVYKFYDKKLPNGGIITRWIRTNQR